MKEIICQHCNQVVEGAVITVVTVNGEQQWCAECANEYTTECRDCGRKLYVEDAEWYHDEAVCPDCFIDSYFHCEHCGDVESLDDSVAVISRYGEESWCEWCADHEATECLHCGDLYDDSYNTLTFIQDLDGHVCDSCYYNLDCFHCDNCGDAFSGARRHDTEDSVYCDDCYNELEDRVIHDYHCYPSSWNINFKRVLDGEAQSRNATLRMGFELEVDKGGEDNDNALAIISNMGEFDRDVIAMHDGSLDDGFEIISQPASLGYHLTKYGVKEAMKEALERDYVSHSSGTCGLHVHVDRQYFTDNVDDPELCFTVLANNNMQWLKKFSRRTYWQYCQFPSQREFDFTKAKSDGKVDELLRDINEMRYDFRGHGSAMNFCGHSTIEIRFNRGTLKFSTFVATLQLVQMMADFCRLRVERVADITLNDFVGVANARGYYEFLNYVTNRKLA